MGAGHCDVGGITNGYRNVKEITLVLPGYLGRSQGTETIALVGV